ncbi:MAG: YgiQ family radical SAM protein [bacterium]
MNQKSSTTPLPAPLPMSRHEMAQRGWPQCDVILVTGDAYVDHPSFGAALIGRHLESCGYRVGIIAAPDPNDVEAFRVLGPPRLFWGVTAGNLDSQLARLTVMRKRRRDDAYLPEGQGDLRPPNATIVYVTKVRQAFKHSAILPSPCGRGAMRRDRSQEDTFESVAAHSAPPTFDHRASIPVIIGGVEASLRRFPYYDYWTDSIKRSILFDSKADLLVYGMGERAIAEVAARLDRGEGLSGTAGTAEIQKKANAEQSTSNIEHRIKDVNNVECLTLNVQCSTFTSLPPYESVAPPTPEGKLAFNVMTRKVLLNAATDTPQTLVQSQGDRQLVVYPPASPLDTSELDRLYALPFTRKPHPVYAGQRIAAYDMIKDSVTTHRGCYGSCAFCAIASHQGKTIHSRSRKGILDEIRHLATSPDFHGTVSDLGGPTANMYGTSCSRQGANCKRPSCLSPELCPNLITDANPQLELLRAARTLPGVNHVFITSGIRFDLALAQDTRGYIAELAQHHVCGRLKIAPEHIAPNVLRLMRKPGLQAYRSFVKRFKEADRAAGKAQQVIEYFVSGHPGCTLADMIELALYLKKENIRAEQVQDFYPAPLTIAAAMFYTGHDPMTGEAVYVARTDNDKALQRALLLCHDSKFHRKAREALMAAGREDLIKVLGC